MRWLTRPWPRPLIAFVAAVVFIALMLSMDVYLDGYVLLGIVLGVVWYVAWPWISGSSRDRDDDREPDCRPRDRYIPLD